MSASQVLLAGHGPEDRWLTETPNRTYFEGKYQSRVNRSRETFEVPFDNQEATFGGTGRCTIPVKGDYLTQLTLRAALPPIYPTQPGQYVFPTPSSQVGGTVYVNLGLTQVTADGTTLTANTTGSHYFSVGAAVTLSGTAYSIFNLDGTYTVASIPTANSFTCLTTIAGLSQNKGTVSSPGIQCGDIVSYFSTQNSNLWVNNLTNKTWQITSTVVNGPQTQMTITTSAPSNFPVGSQVLLNLPGSGIVNQLCDVISSTDITFTCKVNAVFVATGSGVSAYSSDKGQTWVSAPISNDYWGCTAYGNGTFVTVGIYNSSSSYSIDNGKTWTLVSLIGSWQGIAYGNGAFVAVGDGSSVGPGTANTAYSTNGTTWTTGSLNGSWHAVAYSPVTKTFVAVGYNFAANSTTNGATWAPPVSLSGYWNDIAYGNGTFVAVGSGATANSITNGDTWIINSSSEASIGYSGVAYGNGTFVAVGYYHTAYSTDNGATWTPVSVSGPWKKVAYGNGTFVVVGYDLTTYSTDNGVTWEPPVSLPSPSIYWSGIAFGFLYLSSPSDSVSLAVPPLQIMGRTFSSSVYPSISFANTADAAFWGFDARNGLTYSLPATPPWTLTQSGWVAGFLPPSTSTWDDSVAHKLVRDARILVGKQTIKEYTGEYIELQNDLTVSYENKAILKLMNGTLDQTQATAAREYYTTLPIGTKEIPLCALTQQQMSVEIDFESFTNLSQNLNPGTGTFTDSKSYATYNASTGILNGQPINVQTTFSYQQYIFIVTYNGQFIVYDTTKGVNDPGSYIVISNFSGFKQFCVLSGILYIGLTNGQLARMNLDELIQGIVSSFTTNNYTPTIGSLTGTIVADFRYVYYTVSNTATSNVFMSRYDTTASFTNSTSYTTVDFTRNFNSGITGVYQTLTTGTQLIMLPQGVPGKLYTYQLNANVQSQWYTLNYSNYGSQITEGVVIGNSIYFTIDGFNTLTYTNSNFTLSTLSSIFVSTRQSAGYSITNGKSWTYASIPGNYTFYAIAYGNGTFVTCGNGGAIAYSTDYGKTWTISVALNISGFSSAAYGNGTFVALNPSGTSAYSTDDGRTWTVSSMGFNAGYGVAYSPISKTFVAVGYNNTGYSTDNGATWTPVSVSEGYSGVAYGNGTFVAVGYNVTSNSTTNGATWAPPVSLSGSWYSVAYGNGTFVAVGYNHTAYSTDYGASWTPVSLSGTWNGVAYGNRTFVAVGGSGKTVYSTDYGHTWIAVSSINLNCIAVSDPKIIVPGTGFKNLCAVGSKIYASSNSSTVSFVTEIDTSQDLNSVSSYKYYSSSGTSAPITFDGSAPKIFANGPRYVYMFSQGNPTAQSINRFDPYPPTPVLNTSILVDYESLPEGVTKPDKALLGLIQTQRVTDMAHMDIHGPVKELWVTGVPDAANVFQYSNLATKSTLALAGERIVTDDDGTHTFLNIIEPFETHTSMPIRNVSVVSFEFDPESSIPNGTINFSRIRDQVFDGNAQTVWARTYNLLAIQGGTGGLMFN